MLQQQTFFPQILFTRLFNVIDNIEQTNSPTLYHLL